ncbi:MAG: hypothetical protein J7J99_00330 [Thermoprotei archaeon]|nr:hypothetical protein [Thermoprotei archaeon]
MFHVVSSDVGYAKLSDGCVLSIRVAIVEIREGKVLPTGPEFFIGVAVRVYVASCPKDIKKLVKDKPQEFTEDTLKRLDIWELVDIEDVQPAFEECEYRASDGRTYVIRVEIEPTIVARTLEYKDSFGNPVYYVRWSRKDIIKVKR